MLRPDLGRRRKERRPTPSRDRRDVDNLYRGHDAPVLLLNSHGPEAEGDDAGWDAAQDGDAEQQAQGAGRGEGLVCAERAGEDLLLDQSLSPLYETRGQLAPALHRRQVAHVEVNEPGLALLERPGEHVRRDHGVLDGVVDPNPADRAHDVRRVPDEQQPRPVPPRAAARLDREQRRQLPVLQVLDAVGVLRYELREVPVERLDALAAQLGIRALGYDVAGLPVVVAVEHHRDVPPAEAAHYTRGVSLLARQLEPEDVHRRRGLYRLEAGQASHPAPAPVRPDREDGAHLVPAVLRLVADAPDHTVLLDQLPHPRAHNEPEVRVALRLPGDELEEARLGHHRDVRVLRLQAAEVHGREGTRGGLEGEVVQLGVAQLQQPLSQT